MWWTSRKGSWPPHPDEDAASKRAESARPAAGRLRADQPGPPAPGYYVESHTSWHDAAMPDHARRTHRLR